MKKSTLFSLVVAVLFIGLNSCKGQTQSDNKSLQLIATVTLPNVNGRIDHIAFDNKRQILFVAALGNNTVEVVDLKNRKVIHTIKNLDEPQGIAYIPEINSVFISNGGSGECIVFNATSYKQTASIKLPGDADNVRYDSIEKRVYIGYGSGGIAIIDATTFKLITEIKFSGHPESFQIDKSAKKMYVNVPDEKQIVVIDLVKDIVTEKWQVTEATSNFPMCLDEDNHSLIIGCRHPAKLLIKNSQTGRTVSSFDIDSDVDDIFYDNKSSQVFVSCGGGYINVFKRTGINAYTSCGKLASHSGARTSLFIPELNQLIVASPSGLNGDAALLVYSVK